jgi:O-Antigen ligase
MANAADSAAGRPRLHHGPTPVQTWIAALRERGPAIAGVVLPFALILYLGLKGGGYDLVVYSEVGIAIWWIVLLGALVAVLPSASIPRVGWVGLGLIVAFAAWTALGIGWSESAERSAAELGRVATYVGVFALAISITGREGLRRTVNAVAAAIAVIGVMALLSRLHPSWFPADQAAAGLPEVKARLNYPLNYWNGLAALIAMGVPLVLVAAHQARSLLLQALAIAALPAMALAGFYTLSRGGAIELGFALAFLFALYPRRLAILPPLLVAGLGSVILMLAAAQRDQLQDGLGNAVASSQGGEMLAITLVVCAGVGLVQAAIGLAARHGLGPRPEIAPRRAAIGALVALLAIVVVAVAAGAPGELSDRWQEFKQPVDPGGGTSRFESAAGTGRYQAWQSALDANATDPLVGIGPGTFQFWWAREGTVAIFIRDAHSLYLQTLAEVGIVGFALILALFGTIAVAGVRLARSAATLQKRGYAAAAIAGVGTFMVAAAFDWVWSLPVIAIAFLLLAASLLGSRAAEPEPEAAEADAAESAGSGSGRLGGRVALSLIAVGAVVAIAIPLVGTSLVRDSQAQARAATLSGALADAREAHDVQPFAASPLLQEALVLELGGDLAPAANAARSAAEEEPTNWQNWLVLSRLEARLGNADASVTAYRKARALNPRSPIFQ